MKKILASLFVLLLAVFLLPGVASAAEIVDSGSCGENVTWTLDAEGTLTLSGTGDTASYPNVGSGPFYSFASKVKTIVIEEGITSLGDYLFSFCTGATSISIPDSVTSIGDHALYNCQNLISIILPDGLTHIGGNAFASCYDLTSITIPGSVTEIGEAAFWGCSSLNTVTILDGVTAIGKIAFYHCDGLTSITLPDSIISIGASAFFGCSSLPAISLPDGLASIGENAFQYCTSLTNITIPGSLTSFGKSAFIYSGLTSVTILDGVTSIGETAFYECNSLTSVSLPDTLTSISESAFQRCEALTSVTIPDSVTTIGDYAFNWCTNLTSVKMPANLTGIPVGMFNGCSSLTDVTIPSGVTRIGKSAFSKCAMASITIPDGVTTIGEWAFAECNSLTSITIPASVASMDRSVFQLCENLTSIRFEGNAPECPGPLFGGVTATAYYPANESWTEEIRQNYGGEITWIAEKPACTHPKTKTANTKDATCTEDGYTGDTVCADCGTTMKKGEAIPAKGHTYAEGKCTACGEADPNWPTRLAGSHRFETAAVAADQMKANLGIEKFDTVVVASGMDFADALSGSYLAAVNNAPILLACQVEKYNNEVKDYILENLNQGGTIYILGGENAVPASFETGLESFTVERLAGSNRFETNLLVLEKAGVGDKPILVSTGLNFADSLSASAAKLPILLVYGDKLLDSQRTFLEANQGKELCILGGTGAVSEKLETQLKTLGTVERLAGANRFETSVMIAEKFFADPESAVLAYAWNFPDGLCGGPLAATMGAPLILTMEKYETQAASYIQGQSIKTGIILGGEKLIPNASVSTIFGVK